MDNGRIVQQGHHSDLIHVPGIYRALGAGQAAEQLDAMAF